MSVGLGTFLRCLKNERYIDRESIGRLGLSAKISIDNVLVLPRPIKTYSLSCYISKLHSRGLFIFIIIPLFLFLLTRSFVYFVGCLFVRKTAVNNNIIVVGTHDKVVTLALSNLVGLDYLVVYKKMFKGEVGFREGRRRFLYICLWRLMLVRKVYKSISCQSAFCYWSEIFLNSYVFEDLAVFSNFVDGCKEKGASFYLANHYDRWVVMLDRQNVKYSILQHGRLVALDLPYKLKSLHSFYYQDELSLELFRGNIALAFHSHVSFSLLISKLNLRDVSCVSRLEGVHVLYVGEPHLREYEEELLEVLIKDSKVVWLYKPHPRFRSVSFRFEPHANFVRIGADFYPDVSFVFFVGSTLGFEYRAIGIPVVELKGVVFEDVKCIKYSINRLLPANHE